MRIIVFAFLSYLLAYSFSQISFEQTTFIDKGWNWSSK